MKIYLAAYLKGIPLDTGTFFGYKPGFDHTTTIDYVNYVAYMDGEHE